MSRRGLVVVLAVGALVVSVGPVSASAAKPRDLCSNLAGVQRQIPKGFHRVGKTSCRRISTAPDPTKAWAPKVEVFYQQTLGSINTVADVAGRFGHLQGDEWAAAIRGLAQCEANLAVDTGATPATPRAQSAMTQLHTVCSLLTKAAGELATLSATQIETAVTDMTAARSLLKSIVASLGQPT